MTAKLLYRGFIIRLGGLKANEDPDLFYVHKDGADLQPRRHGFISVSTAKSAIDRVITISKRV